jgi:hypothetical protein
MNGSITSLNHSLLESSNSYEVITGLQQQLFQKQFQFQNFAES